MSVEPHRAGDRYLPIASAFEAGDFADAGGRDRDHYSARTSTGTAESARMRFSPCVEGVRVHSQISPRLTRAAMAVVTGLALVVGGVATAPAFADEVGQAPTAANITGDGSFATTSSTITGQSGFGGGTVYYPTAVGKYPVVAVVPGFVSFWSQISWLGPRLASWGF